MNKFNKTIANQIANITLDSLIFDLLESHDNDFSLAKSGEDYLQDFEEDLIKMGFKVTEGRLKSICDSYDKKLEKLKSSIKKHYSPNLRN